MRIKMLYLLLCACVGSSARLQAAGEADFAERLKAVGAATKSIECAFTLTRTMSFMASDAVSQGRFYYLRGEGISLDFSRPAGEQITMGRERFRIVSSGKTTVVKVDSNPALRQLQQMLTACMTGDVALLQSGSEVTYGDAEDRYVVTISPADRRAKNRVKLITLTFEKEHMSLVTLRLEEATGDVSQYRFFDKQFNTEIDPARFQVQ